MTLVLYRVLIDPGHGGTATCTSNQPQRQGAMAVWTAPSQPARAPLLAGRRQRSTEVHLPAQLRQRDCNPGTCRH